MTFATTFVFYLTFGAGVAAALLLRGRGRTGGPAALPVRRGSLFLAPVYPARSRINRRGIALDGNPRGRTIVRFAARAIAAS